jgi:ADP-dependent NAD(P)H-hydrate dehydratase / NAD(P)H-hydrate epimerase
MKAVTRDQMRALDRRTIEDAGVPGTVLMARAGAGLADAVDGAIDPDRRGRFPVWLAAGRGNNGGDVCVAARLLRERGFAVTVTLSGTADAVRGDARRALDAMRAAGIVPAECADPADWTTLPAGRCAAAVDGLLGTGATGAPRGPAETAIRAVNRAGEAGAPVIAVDIPSGLDANTGAAPGAVVRADMTVTMGLPKRGLLLPAALEWVGRVVAVPIGIPAESIDPIESDLDLITPFDPGLRLPPRRRDAHKGHFGHALLIGGAPGYSGAITLAARACLRAGAGLVSVLTPAAVAPIVAAGVQEAMVHAAPGNVLDAGCLDAWPPDLGAFSSVLVGPGLTPHAGAAALVDRLLGETGTPLLVDADALNALAGRPERLRRGAPVSITPHPGEAARLLGVTAAEVQADRFTAAWRLADAAGAVAVLKGAGTLVAAAGAPLGVNLTGNPGMATGGTGDVLSGLITGLAAQGMAPAAAARLGVYLHGAAGDAAARRGTPHTMIAGDLVDALHFAVREFNAARRRFAA